MKKTVTIFNDKAGKASSEKAQDFALRPGVTVPSSTAVSVTGSTSGELPTLQPSAAFNAELLKTLLTTSTTAWGHLSPTKNQTAGTEALPELRHQFQVRAAPVGHRKHKRSLFSHGDLSPHTRFMPPERKRSAPIRLLTRSCGRAAASSSQSAGQEALGAELLAL